MLLRTFSWYSGCTRDSRSSIDSTIEGRMLSQACRMSWVTSSCVGLPLTGAVTTTGALGAPTKLPCSFHSRTMWIENFASG